MTMQGTLAVITGGTGAIGSAVARELAARGANLVLVYRSNEDRARQVAESLGVGSGRVHLMRCDVGDPADVRRMADDTIRQWGDAGILVHCAGTRSDGAMMLMSDESWRDVLRSGLDGAMYCARAFVRGMIAKRNGSIVFLSSASALRGVAGQANYSAAKAGVIGLTRSLAAELGRFSIRVNAVAPGLVDSELVKDLPEAQRERLIKGAALARAGTPGEIAKAVAFLAGDDASFVTGQVLSVDGGL